MSNRAIREAVAILAGTHKIDKVYSITAEVVSVDISARTCVCEQISGASTVLNDVLLMASVDDGFLIIPEIGSTVNIIVSDKTEPFICQYSGIEKIIFRGGDLGGLVIVKPLVQKINALENKLNSLLTKFNMHTHNVTAIGAPTGPNILQEVGSVVITKIIDLENKNITHG